MFPIIYEIMQWVVTIAGFVAWTLFLPQIVRLVRLKDGSAIDMKLMWGSVFMQGLLLSYGTLQGVVEGVWALVFMYTPNLITVLVLTLVTREVKRHPDQGGVLVKHIEKLLAVIEKLLKPIKKLFSKK